MTLIPTSSIYLPPTFKNVIHTISYYLFDTFFSSTAIIDKLTTTYSRVDKIHLQRMDFVDNSRKTFAWQSFFCYYMYVLTCG